MSRNLLETIDSHLYSLEETGIKTFALASGGRFDSPDNMDQTDNSIEIMTDHEFLLENRHWTVVYS